MKKLPIVAVGLIVAALVTGITSLFKPYFFLFPTAFLLFIAGMFCATAIAMKPGRDASGKKSLSADPRLTWKKVRAGWKTYEQRCIR